MWEVIEEWGNGLEKSKETQAGVALGPGEGREGA